MKESMERQSWALMGDLLAVQAAEAAGEDPIQAMLDNVGKPAAP